jgi:hypothetical protein
MQHRNIANLRSYFRRHCELSEATYPSIDATT